MKDPTVRWFDKQKRIGHMHTRDDGSWMFRIGGVEHVLSGSDLRAFLRAMRRRRDFQEGMAAAQRRAAAIAERSVKA